LSDHNVSFRCPDASSCCWRFSWRRTNEVFLYDLFFFCIRWWVCLSFLDLLSLVFWRFSFAFEGALPDFLAQREVFFFFFCTPSLLSSNVSLAVRFYYGHWIRGVGPFFCWTELFPLLCLDFFFSNRVHRRVLAGSSFTLFRFELLPPSRPPSSCHPLSQLMTGRFLLGIEATIDRTPFINVGFLYLDIVASSLILESSRCLS